MKSVSAYIVCPARTYSNRGMFPSHLSRGKTIAVCKGVHCEVESEGAPRQPSDSTYRNFTSVDDSAKQGKSYIIGQKETSHSMVEIDIRENVKVVFVARKSLVLYAVIN